MDTTETKKQKKHEGTVGYADEAPVLFERYEALDSEIVHQPVLHLFAEKGASVVDIGAGTGRDAAFFAAGGYEVTAVEPTNELREGARRLHAAPTIEWIDDALPELPVLLARSRTWDMVMLTAVWMHLDLTERALAMQVIAQLTHPGSRVFMSLRHGDVPEGRVMYDVSGEETTTLANEWGFRTVYCETRASAHIDFRSAGIQWTNVVLEKREFIES